MDVIPANAKAEAPPTRCSNLVVTGGSQSEEVGLKEVGLEGEELKQLISPHCT